MPKLHPSAAPRRNVPTPHRLRRSRRVDPIVHRCRGTWNPDLVGYPGYPKTLEAFEEKQRKNRERFQKWKEEGRFPNRRGVPNGFAGAREAIDQGRAEARTEAKEIIAKMKRNGEPSEDPRSEESLEAAIEVVRAKAEDANGRRDYLYGVADRLKAAKLVLEFTKAKPATKNEVTIQRAEDFLEGLARESSQAG
jgi:hypothetical protein